MKSLQLVVALDSSESAGGRCQVQETAFLMNILPIFRIHVFFTFYQGFELFITAGGTCSVHIFSPFKAILSYLASPSTLFEMNNPQQHGQNEEHEPIIPGFETPPSPKSSYDNVYNIKEDEGRGLPPEAPPYLLEPMTIRRLTTGQETPDQTPHRVVLNHLCTNVYDRKFSWEPVGVATTHRVGSKYVTNVLYKPPPQKGNGSPNCTRDAQV